MKKPSALISFLVLSFLTLSLNHAFAQNATLTNSGKFIYRDNGKETVITTNPDDIVLITPYDGSLYYIERKHAGADNAQHMEARIMSYNIKTGRRKEVAAQGDKADYNYKIKNDIVALCIDKVSKRLYFSTSVPGSKITEYLTWYYDLSTGDIKIFKDGKVETADEFGNLKVIINGLDGKGPFAQTAVFASNGSMISMTNKAY